jgi:hypothetical protein
MFFYTDTNGQYPRDLSVALRLLEITMETTPLDEINFEQFNGIVPVIDAKESEGNKGV